jgi:hypothetical protein
MSLAALSAILLFSLTLVASAQTLINGANQAGILLVNTTNSYTFTANAGDSINLRQGTTGFKGYLELYGPTGALLGTAAGNSTDQLIAYTATTNGTFTVLVSSEYYGGTGTYVLNLAQIPEPFIVPAGDGGGTLTNGADATGTITLGRQDLWSFTANKGDSINVRQGTTGFKGYLELYGPTGALLGTAAGNSTDQLIAYTATTNGTFTVLVSSEYSGGTGTYVLNLAQIPEPFIVPAGDDGGTLTNGANATGTITLGDQDMWSFTANKGESINVRLASTFPGNLELYGPNGALLVDAGENAEDELIAYTATTNGTFTVLVSGYYGTDTGTYVLNLSEIPEPFIVPAGDGGGTLTNGANATGTITLGRQDLWSFTANKGESINVRLGSTFSGNLELYGPNGALLVDAGDNDPDELIAYTATTNGTFTVLVSAYYSGGTGTYVLNLSQIPEPFIVPAGDGGGTLTNGANATGTITLARQDLWSFTANKGDSINLRLGTFGFPGNLELYGPSGALLNDAGDNDPDELIAYTATTNGTFTVLVSADFGDGIEGGTGTYVLNLSQIPEPFIVPAGDGGGTLTNGADATGTITLARQDLWSFTANKGDSINLRLGTFGFPGNLELYGPSGALLVDAGDNDPDELIEDYVATTNGTFTVLVSADFGDGIEGGTGTYALRLAQMPEPFIVSSGDQGGGMTGSASYAGTITLGDQDMWAFTACTGDSINLGLTTTNFGRYGGLLELYGPNGALLQTTSDGTNLSIAYTATNCGTFTVLVSADFGDGVEGGTGTYGLTANGLVYELMECLPKISGTNFTFNGVGGNTNANAGFVLYSTTNVATPFGLWTPVLTNQFDQFGVFGYTNIYNLTQRQEFFRFLVP